MSSSGSVSAWLARLAQGDREAVAHLWRRYYPQLVRLARHRLQGAPALRDQAEDVALSAFDNFCRGAEQGRFPDLFDRDDLWQLLVVLTARKAARLVRDEQRQKRGGGVQSLSAAVEADSAEGPAFTDLIAREPGPQFAAQAAEEYRRLLACLDDLRLRQVAVWKMEGYSNEEIAGRLGRSVPTVERKLRLIRKTWENEVPP